MHSIRMRAPVHPGDLLKHELLGSLGLTVGDAARALHVSDIELSSILNEEMRLPAEIALRIEKAFGVSMDTLMRMQCSYDIATMRKREDEIEVERFVASV